MKPLSQQLAIFNDVAKEIELDRFYHVEITEYRMKIQGDLTQLDYCRSLTEMVLMEDHGFDRYEGNYNGIEIILI